MVDSLYSLFLRVFVLFLFCVALPPCHTAASQRPFYPPPSHDPNKLFRSYRNALPKPLFDLMENDVLAMSEYEASLPAFVNGKRTTRWMPLDHEPVTVLEEAILYLAKLAKPPADCGGYEWWIQKVKEEEPIGFHVDKDESIASLKHYLVHAMYSSVFYVTAEGGGTLITNQYSPNGNGYSPLQPEFAAWSFPEQNKYLVFDGTLLHGVVPSNTKLSRNRLTFLINYWKEKPESPNCELLDHSQVPGLKLYTPAQMAALRARIRDSMESGESPRMKRQALSTLDLTPGTPYATTPFKIMLPGGASQTVSLPSLTSPGVTYHLKWKDTPHDSAQNHLSEQQKVEKKKSKKKKKQKKSKKQKTSNGSSVSKQRVDIEEDDERDVSTKNESGAAPSPDQQNNHANDKLARARALKEEMKQRLKSEL